MGLNKNIVIIALLFVIVLGLGIAVNFGTTQSTTVRAESNSDLKQRNTSVAAPNRTSDNTAMTGQPNEKVMAQSAGQYRVQGGDSLYLIARRYNTTVTQLKQMNNLTGDTIYVGELLNVPGSNNNTTDQPVQTVQAILSKLGYNGSNPNFMIVVSKSQHVLQLFYNRQLVKSYHVELSENGLADKAISGDHLTPEGTFYIAEKTVLNPVDPYLGNRWMRLSYPNPEDAERGLNQGLISQWEYQQIISQNNQRLIPLQNTKLGGGVGIHGGDQPSLGHNWTYGCVGLKDSDIDQFYNYLPVGTPVVIVG
ncbi:MAG TPA: L,D-transpeptidase family protein [Bacillota bacterium]|nr:L,D-transpeptidase family protein [Bacillota bacterium]